MEIVKFNNGKYGIRVKKRVKFLGITWRDYRYLDLMNYEYTWPEDSEYCRDCQTSSESKIMNIFDEIKGLSLSEFRRIKRNEREPKVIRK